MRKTLLTVIAAAVLAVAPRLLSAQGDQPAVPPAATVPPAAAVHPSTPSSPLRVEMIDKIIVVVNGEIFTEAELERKQIEELRSRNLDVEDTKALQDDATLGKLLAQITPQLLVDIIDELLLVQRGRELDIKFTDDRFKEAVDNLKKDRSWDDKALAAALKESSMTMDDLRESFEHTFIEKQVQIQEFGQSAQVTEEEERQYYNDHKNEFLTPATVTLRDLLIAVPVRAQNGQPSFNVGADNAAKTKIQDLKARADKGEDFGALASTSSDDAITKSNGGLMPPLKVSELNPALGDVLNTLQPGQITEPLRVAQGYQIYKLEARNGAAIPPFEAVRDLAEQKILDERLPAEMKKLLDRLRAQALIQWKDETFRDMYEKRLHEVAAP